MSIQFSERWYVAFTWLSAEPMTPDPIKNGKHSSREAISKAPINTSFNEDQKFNSSSGNGRRKQANIYEALSKQIIYMNVNRNKMRMRDAKGFNSGLDLSAAPFPPHIKQRKAIHATEIPSMFITDITNQMQPFLIAESKHHLQIFLK